MGARRPRVIGGCPAAWPVCQRGVRAAREQPSAAVLLISLCYSGKPLTHSPSSHVSVSSHPWGLFPPCQCLSSAATIHVPQDLPAPQISHYTPTSCSQSAQNVWGQTDGTVLTVRKQLHPSLLGQDHVLTRNHLQSPSKKGHFQHRCERGWKGKQ
ncbi:unnamed protein product [Bubo scandiacus]